MAAANEKKAAGKSKLGCKWADVLVFAPYCSCDERCANPDCDEGDEGGGFTRLMCCGILEYSGLSSITSHSRAVALRVAARLVGNSGYVICTSTRDGTVTKHLISAGFQVLTPSFKNPRSGSIITLWGALTLHPDEVDIIGGPDDEDDDDDEDW